MRILAVLCLVLAGCAQAKVSGYTDNTYKGQRYTSAIVLAADVPALIREDAESYAAKLLEKHGVRAIKSVDILPPTRKYSEQEISDIVARTGAETTLAINMTAAGYTTYQTPSVTYGGGVSGTVVNHGNTSTFHMEQDPAYTQPGQTLYKPNGAYFITLTDNRRNHAIIWRGDGFGAGNAFSTYTDVTKAALSEAVSSMVEDGLF